MFATASASQKAILFVFPLVRPTAANRLPSPCSHPVSTTARSLVLPRQWLLHPCARRHRLCTRILLIKRVSGGQRDRVRVCSVKRKRFCIPKDLSPTQLCARVRLRGIHTNFILYTYTCTHTHTCTRVHV
jgi:hypothetical protein